MHANIEQIKKLNLWFCLRRVAKNKKKKAVASEIGDWIIFM